MTDRRHRGAGPRRRAGRHKGRSLAEAGCDLADVVKAMVWLRERADFPGFNQVYGEYFPDDPPARSAVVSELLVDVRVEIEVVAYQPRG